MILGQCLDRSWKTEQLSLICNNLYFLRYHRMYINVHHRCSRKRVTWCSLFVRVLDSRSWVWVSLAPSSSSTQTEEYSMRRLREVYFHGREINLWRIKNTEINKRDYLPEIKNWRFLQESFTNLSKILQESFLNPSRIWRHRFIDHLKVKHGRNNRDSGHSES